jgi:biopolymer transport protein ExbD
MATTILRALVLSALLAGCISPVMTFGSGKTAKQAQRDTMSDFGPARLATDQKWPGEVETKKIRVWADNQYRTQNRQWQQSFEKPLELANLVLTPVVGVHLRAEYVVWDRHVPDATLNDDIEALMERDPGNDVFMVVGLTSSLPLVSATFDELGRAMIGGRHMVMRGYADLAERKMYANAFPDLRAEEREMALDHLRHHKTAVVLLHEIGHVLGAEHEPDGDTIMKATYSNHATAFSASSRAVMLRTVDQRLQRKSTTADPIAPKTASAPVPAESTPRAPKVHRAPVIIRVTKKGETIVDGKRLKGDALDARLQEVFSEDAETKIVIQEDRKVPTGAVGALLDRAKAIGFSNFELAWSGH